MQLKIHNYELDNNVYTCNAWVNGEPVEAEIKEYDIFISHEASEGEVQVRIELINERISKPHGIGYIILYWIGSLVHILLSDSDWFSHTSRDSVFQRFGKPYNAVLEFTCRANQSIGMYTNPIWNEKPFAVEYGRIKEVEHGFTTQREYKVRWAAGVGMPQILLMTLIFLLFLLWSVLDGGVLVIKGMFAFFALLGEIGIIVYVWKVLNRH
ncbi:MAG: hypothetical protein Q4G58_04600 [bacterium]|nr:hypothetical protein [bacterium]